MSWTWWHKESARCDMALQRAQSKPPEVNGINWRGMRVETWKALGLRKDEIEADVKTARSGALGLWRDEAGIEVKLDL